MRQPSTRGRQKIRGRSDRAKELFLAVVSHELRTPTAAILGWVAVIGQGQPDGETIAHGIKAIERNARLQEQLIAQLLDFSRVNNGCLRLDARKTSLAPIVEAAVDTMTPLAKVKQIDLSVSLDASAGAVVGDASRLQQVVTNILANAIKFTPPGGRVEVRLARRGACAEVTVSDTGRGIRPEFMPHVFDPFRRADEGGALARDGLGLGMAIARHIIEGHEGKISAASLGEGKGATFTISLPLEGETAATNPQA